MLAQICNILCKVEISETTEIEFRQFEFRQIERIYSSISSLLTDSILCFRSRDCPIGKSYNSYADMCFH